jgi:glycosyltransferase involved in cell wall biosynthesis
VKFCDSQNARDGHAAQVITEMHVVSQKRNPLKVAIVAPTLRILGGHSVQAQRMLEGWSNTADVESWLVPINPVPPRPFDALLTVKYLRTIATQLAYWPLLVREIRRADVVHVFSASFASFLLSPLPAVMIARLFGRPVLLNYHSGEANEHLSRSRIARFVLRHWVDLIAVPSSYLRDVMASYGLPAVVVFNTIDPTAFPYRQRQLVRPRLLCTRNFETHYNLPCVLRAFARVQARYPEASLTLVGSGSQEAAVRQCAAELRLNHVTFAGRVAPDDMPSFYADADIYLQAPSIDNMPLSVLEAFASGLPVVSTGIGGIPRILQHDVHGLLAPADDDAALAGHVMSLIDDPQLADRLATAAQATCAAYGWSAVRPEWLTAYRQLLRSAA